MDILSFSFGILAMSAVIFIIVIVVGLVKVTKNSRRITEVFEYLDGMQREFIEQNDIRADEVHTLRNEMTLRIDENRSYIDSRIDKLK